VAAARARRALAGLLAAKLREARSRQPSEAWSAADACEGSSPGGCLPQEQASLPDWARAAAQEWHQAASTTGGTDAWETAVLLAESFHWPVQHTVERLSSTAAVAHYAAAPSLPGPSPAAQDQQGTAGQPGKEAEGDVAAGVRVTPWLCVGSLRSGQSDLAVHATLPALRRHWCCPGCCTKLIGTASEISVHVGECSAAAGLSADDVQRGYSSGGAGGQDPAKDKWKLSVTEPLELQRAQDTSAASREGGWPPRRDLRDQQEDEESGRLGGSKTAATAQRPEPERREYYCGACRQRFILTSTEILQHKKAHSRVGAP